MKDEDQEAALPMLEGVSDAVRVILATLAQHAEKVRAALERIDDA